MKTAKLMCFTFCILVFCSASLAEELSTFRLLSLSESEKLILVSEVPDKTNISTRRVFRQDHHQRRAGRIQIAEIILQDSAENGDSQGVQAWN